MEILQNYFIDKNTIKTVSGIDKLKYYIRVDYTQYHSFYRQFILNNKLISDEFIKLSPDREQYFTYYNRLILLNDDLEQFYKIGFKNINSSSKLDDIEIDINSSFLHFYGAEECVRMIDEDINIFGLKVLKHQISWFDTNIFVVGYDFSHIELNMFRSRTLKAGKVIGMAEHGNMELLKNTNLETLYMGNRNNIQMIIYNKEKELRNKKQFLKRAIIKSLFRAKYKDRAFNDLWNIEFRFRRSALKSFHIDTVEEAIRNVNSLFNKMMNSFVYLDPLSKNMTNKSDIKPHKLWTFIKSSYIYNQYPINDIKRISSKNYIHDDTWLNNCIVKYLKSNPDRDIAYIKKFIAKAQ